MATTTQIAAPVRSTSPLALWHLLSLDAPTVATLWVWFVARSQHVSLPWSATAAMAVAVWMLYAADRLLDTRNLGHARAEGAGEFEARHFFHYRHRHSFLVAILIAAVTLAALLPRLDAVAIRLYLIEGVLLFAWLVIVHAPRGPNRLPKEIAVGLFFSAAVFIPTVAREPSLRVSLLPAAALVGALCSLNCLFIYAWEHEGTSPLPAGVRSPHPSTRIAVAHLPVIASAILFACVATTALAAQPIRPIACSCAVAMALLLLLHRARHGLSRNHLRAAADLALLTPLLLIAFL